MLRPAAAFALLAAATGEAASGPVQTDRAATADLCGVAVALPADVRIASAQPVAAGGTVAGVAGYAPTRAFCRVSGTIEAEIGFELWLPVPSDWNRRFLGAGVGGQAGSIAVRDLARGVERGYAAASTDTGHKASDERWLLGRPDRAANYAERGNHLLAVNAKALVAAYYRAKPRTAVFVGCSGGGRQAMTELQRFPDDYDAILAGAPGVDTPEMSARRLWEMVQHDRYKGVLDAAGWKRIADAAVKQCDPEDGVADGLIEDPRRCGFRPAALACTADAKPGCLSPGQVAVAERLYAPLHDENGKRIDAGILPGTPVSPVPVPEPFTPGPKYLATVLFGQGVHNDPDWDARRLSIADDLPAIDRVMNLHADDPKIDRFVRRGGKLILYHGWADTLVSPMPTIAYYQALEKRFGSRKVADFARLFPVAAMDHCRGGGVPDRFGGAGGLDSEGLSRAPEHDLLSALERWVDTGQAPASLVAAQMADGRPIRTRPLCAWPTRPRYRGGPVDRAESFTCSGDTRS